MAKAKRNGLRAMEVQDDSALALEDVDAILDTHDAVNAAAQRQIKCLTFLLAQRNYEVAGLQKLIIDGW